MSLARATLLVTLVVAAANAEKEACSPESPSLLQITSSVHEQEPHRSAGTQLLQVAARTGEVSQFTQQDEEAPARSKHIVIRDTDDESGPVIQSLLKRGADPNNNNAEKSNSKNNNAGEEEEAPAKGKKSKANNNNAESSNAENSKSNNVETSSNAESSNSEKNSNSDYATNNGESSNSGKNSNSENNGEEQVAEGARIAPFGKEDTARELQHHAARTQDTLVDAIENAEVAEIKRSIFRSLTRLRAAEIKEFDTIARLETQAIDEYNDNHHYRAENPLDYIHAAEEGVKTDKYTSFHD